jgi:protein-S-isoprenylcysteine O-methyltransferase Ste14
MTNLDKLRLTAFAVVVATWIAFGFFFYFGRRKQKAAPEHEAKRDPASYWGIAIQSVAIFAVWVFHRNDLGPFLPIPMPLWAQAAILFAGMLIAVLSLWLSIAAVRTLGKQWTYVARVIEGHRLITTGPYRFVRNPIYLSMFGSLIATGLVFTRWWALAAAIPIFLIGTWIRISREEKLLASTFGPEWQDYKRRAPALFPGL